MRIFISYAHDDKTWVHELARELREFYEIWIDRNLLGAEIWWDTILDEIEKADCVIAVLSPRAVESIYCEAELKYALELNKPILPLIHKPCNFPQALKNIHAIDISTNSLERALLRSVQALSEVRYKLARQPALKSLTPKPPRPPQPIPKKGNDRHFSELYGEAIQAIVNKNYTLAIHFLETLIRSDAPHSKGIVQEKLDSLHQEIARDQSYAQVAGMARSNGSLQAARQAWADHIRQYGDEYDPQHLARALETPEERERRKITSRRNFLSIIRDDKVSLAERADAGRRLAEYGDPRAGVGLRKDGLPGIQWLMISEGQFLMGSDRAKDPEAKDNELPQRRVKLPTYYMAEFPITVAQYRVFVHDAGYSNPDFWTKAGWRWKGDLRQPVEYWDNPEWTVPNYPVVGITWYEAAAFCRWLTHVMPANGWPEDLAKHIYSGDRRDKQLRREGWQFRLPTEAEWEKAARGTDGQVYISDNLSVLKKERSGSARKTMVGINQVATVGIFPTDISACKVRDLSSNVRDWCLSCYSNPYKFPEDNSLEGEHTRVVRGGSWTRGTVNVRAAHRSPRNAWDRDYDMGFRVVCAMSPR